MNEPVPEEEGDRRFRTLALVSAGVSLLFIGIQLLITFSVAPGFADMYRGLGSDLSLWARLIGSLGSFGLAAFLLMIDIAVYVVMYLMARRHGIGLLFVPIVVHLGLAMLLPLLLYMPMFRVFDLIQ